MACSSIYGLYDTRFPDIIMYVGKGSAKRAKHHWPEFLRHGTAENVLQLQWFEKLKVDGIAPNWKFLEENVIDWEAAERTWIGLMRVCNPNLCNISDGGNQWPIEASRSGGLSRSPVKLAAIRLNGLKGCRLGGSSKTRKGGWRHSDEAKKKISKAFCGRIISNEHKQKISEALRSKKKRDDDLLNGTIIQSNVTR